MSDLVNDPVCGMEVEPNQNQTTYLGMTFAFCSDQCRQRFMANPNLYIGKPGHVAAKQAGIKLIKKRRMHLAAPMSIDEAGKLVEALKSMMGIKEVAVKGTLVEISYDLLEATAEQIEAQMEVIGVRIGEGWGERLRRAFVHYEEECELGNLEANDKPCCSGRG